MEAIFTRMELIERASKRKKILFVFYFENLNLINRLIINGYCLRLENFILRRLFFQKRVSVGDFFTNQSGITEYLLGQVDTPMQPCPLLLIPVPAYPPPQTHLPPYGDR
jgi:hypothetical protein